MNWFKNLFRSTAIQDPKDAEHNTNAHGNLDPDDIVAKISASFQYKLIGIDHDFIDLFYFKDEISKNDYLKSLQEILDNLHIQAGMDIVTVQNIIADDNLKNGGEVLPFLADSLLYDAILISSIERDGKIQTSETPGEGFLIGREKINNYYAALKFIQVNLDRKIDTNYFDFQFEEELLNDTLSNSETFNFARIETLVAFGKAYLAAHNFAKMDEVFNIILTEKYDLAESTIANFYREIGETYLKLERSDQALKWLKSGLNLNPKLGVKKLIERIEKESTN
jgi:tetratricopeptide (TPR) repeat protein